MFFLGIIGLLQMAVLPGWLWLRAAKIHTQNPCEESLYSFSASLILNHLLVFVLDILGQNNRAAWLAIVAAEAVLLMLLLHPWRRLHLHLVSSARAEQPSRSFVQVGLAAIALVTALAFIPVLIANWGTVFTANDDVASWDRWARDWFHNRLPFGSDLYPQLLPANWSITYALMQTDEVKMFAKSIMPFFALAIPLLFVSLAWNRRDRVYLAGSAISGFLLLQYLGRAFLMTGYVDVALAFFCFLAFYVLYQEPANPSRQARPLALFFATGAALSKQGGLLALIAILVYLAAIWRKRGHEPHASGGLIWTTSLSTTFTALWYLPKIDAAFQGNSNLQIVLHDVHAGRNYAERLWYGCRLLIVAGGSNGALLFILGVAVTLCGLVFSETRKLTLGIVLPAFLLWGCFFSYELRTGALLIPFGALVLCLTLRDMGTWLWARLKLRTWLQGTIAWEAAALLLLGTGILLQYDGNVGTQLRLNYAWPLMIAAVMIAIVPAVPVIRRVRISVPAIFTGLALVTGLAAQSGHSGSLLIEQQRSQQRMIGKAAVDARLYRLHDSGQLDQGVLSNYWYLSALPELGSLNRLMNCGDCSMPGLWATITGTSDAGFVLIEDDFLPASTSFAIAHCTALDLVFTEGTVRLFHINRARLGQSCSVDVETIRPVIEKLYPADTQAGVGFNMQPDGSAAIGIATRNASHFAVIIWAGTELSATHAGTTAISAEVPRRLYTRPGRYPIEIFDKDTGLRSSVMYFDVK